MKSVEEGRTKVGRGWSADLDVSVKMLARMAVSLGLKADRALRSSSDVHTLRSP